MHAAAVFGNLRLCFGYFTTPFTPAYAAHGRNYFVRRTNMSACA